MIPSARRNGPRPAPDDIFQPLVEEHRAVIAFLDELREWRERVEEESASRPLTCFYETVGLVRRLSEVDAELELHFRKEEEALFPLIERHVGRGGPMEVMADEHARLRELRRKALSAASAAESGRFLDEFDRVAAELDDLLRNHIAKEDDIVFPLGRDVLTPAEIAEARAKIADLTVAA